VAAISGALMPKPQEKTIQDFGDQWLRYSQNEGYYASLDLFKDICGPLLSVSEIEGKKVLDLGSGTGRIVKMLLDAGAARVVAVEPSVAFEKLVANTLPWKDKISYIHAKGEDIREANVDFAFSIGVLHHIPDPLPAVKKVFACLKPGGKFLIWVYGQEGNHLYLRIFQPIRAVTSKLPDWVLAGLAHLLNFLLLIYMFFCKFLPLPFHRYIRGVFSKLDFRNRFLVIFDQLNPEYARYYHKEEAENLLKKAGLINIASFHRHSYSWTVLGEKPL
jgi:SAM-dependent methyltransferase